MSVSVATFTSVLAEYLPNELLREELNRRSSLLYRLSEQGSHQWRGGYQTVPLSFTGAIEEYGRGIPYSLAPLQEELDRLHEAICLPTLKFDLDKIAAFDDALDQSMKEFTA